MKEGAMVFSSYIQYLGLTLILSVNPTDQWNQWRGPSGNSQSNYTNLPIKWNESQNIAWKCELPGEGASTPCIWDDCVFVTSQDGDKLLAARIELKTGKLNWQKQLSSGEVQREALKGKPGDQRRRQKFHKLHNLASPSPTTNGTSVVFLYGNGELFCTDFNGNIQWQKNLQNEHGTFTIWWGYANSPFIFNDLVICTVMQDSLSDLEGTKAESYLVAYSLKDGKQVWKTQRPTQAKAESCDSYTTPLPFRFGKNLEIIIMGGNQLDAYDPQTGKQLWVRTDFPGGRTITGPGLLGNTVVATQGMRGPTFAFELDSQTGKPNTEKPIWQHTKNTPDSCCPVGNGNLIFTVSDNGFAQCLDSKTGNLNWSERLQGDFKSSPLANNGVVYFTNLNGECTAIKADPSFQILSKNNLGEGVIASPAVARNHLFFHTKKGITCVGSGFSK